MQLQRKTFIQTHVHSDYSLLDSIARISDLINKAKQLEMPGLAITDHGSLSGTWKFYNTCKENDINPILGYEAYVFNRKKFLKTQNKNKLKFHHLILLAKNYNGFLNILKLHGEAVRNAYFRRPILDDELIFENSKDLICTSACIGSRFAKSILDNKIAKTKSWLRRYQEVFKSDFYIELHINEIPNQKKVNKVLIDLAREMKIKLIYAGDVHYLDKEDNKVQELALLIQQNKTVNELERYKQLLKSGKTRDEIPSADRVFHFDIEDVSFKSYSEVLDSVNRYGYGDIKEEVLESLKNTFEINEKVKIELPKGIYHFPKYVDDADTKLEKLARKRFNKTSMVHKKDYVERFEHELKIIKSKGFSNYLLLICDLCTFARKQNIFMSPGRGSVAGSLVAYILKITTIDPIEHRLFFERFLNPIRSEPPDIDLDFESERRDEIEQYLIGKYGAEKVSKIANFITFAGKSIIRDLARVMGFGQTGIRLFINDFKEKTWEILDFAEEIDRVEGMNPEAEKFFKDNPLFKRACIKLHNVHRHLGVHAAGIVIAPDRIENYVPITRVGKQIVVALREGSDAREVSEAGMLKVDILGLLNCSAIRKTLNNILETRHANLELKIKSLDLDDTKLLRRFAKGDTEGIFQFEGDSITGLLKKIKPNTFDDIVMINALHRPATLMSGIAQAVVEGQSVITQPKVAEILKDTRGNVIFQEQVISLFHEIAGFSLEEADVARQIMKKSSRLGQKPQAYKDVISKFKAGCKKHSPDLSKSDQQQLLNYLDSFNEYSFNRSHAVSYSYLAMQTMYLKVYYFLEYMAAVLNTFENKEVGIGKNKKNKLEKLLHYAQGRGLEILPIRIGKSKSDFRVEGSTLRMGIVILKGIGPTTAKLFNDLNLASKFNVDDFFNSKLNRKLTHKRTMEALIKIGAFEEATEYNARTIWEAYLAWSKKKKKPFSSFIKKVPDFAFDEKLAFEYKYLGFYFKRHPLDLYEDVLKDKRLTTLAEAKKNGAGIVAVQLLKVTPYETRQAGKMAFLDVADKTDRADVVVWSSVYDTHYQILKANTLVLLKVRKNQRGGFELDGRSPVIKLSEIQAEGKIQ